MRRRAFWLAWALGGLCAAMFAACVGFAFLALLASGESLYGIGALVIFVPFLAFPVVGALIASRRPGNPIGWICLVAGLFWMFIGLTEQFGAYLAANSVEFGSSATVGALTQWMWVPPVGLLGIYMILLFPDGKLPSRRWRPLAWFSGALMVLLSLGFVFLPGPLATRPETRNPLGLESLAWATDLAVFVILLLPGCILAAAISLVFRYRRARGEVRQQIKWLAFAACLLGAIYFGGLLAQIIFVPGSTDSEATTPEPAWSLLVDNLTFMSYAGIPIAVGIAVLKYRLYDIEVILNRTLVYGTLTATLALVYFGGVAGLQWLLSPVVDEGNGLAVVASTLLIAALFQPLRSRVQALVDRRFYRRKYDARKTLESFSAKLRVTSDLDGLNEEVLAVVGETVQPEHAGLWLRPDTGHDQKNTVGRSW